MKWEDFIKNVFVLQKNKKLQLTFGTFLYIVYKKLKKNKKIIEIKW